MSNHKTDEQLVRAYKQTYKPLTPHEQRVREVIGDVDEPRPLRIKDLRKQKVENLPESEFDINTIKPMALGNLNENNILFDIFFGGPVISKGFKLVKNPNIVRRIINKGKDLVSSTTGKFVTKHADDILVINSLGNTKK